MEVCAICKGDQAGYSRLENGRKKWYCVECWEWKMWREQWMKEEMAGVRHHVRERKRIPQPKKRKRA